MDKQLNVLVGGNGSGKTTFYYRYLKKLGLPFLNADELAKLKWPKEPEKHSYDAAKEIEQQRLLYVATGQSFCFETVFSHTSKVDFLANAFSQGYKINLFVIHIDDQGDTNVVRVANRTNHGGHSVPEDKIRSRIPRMLLNVRAALPFCNTVSFYDNTDSTKGFSCLAILQTNRCLLHYKALPKWLTSCVKGQYLNSISHKI